MSALEAIGDLLALLVACALVLSPSLLLILLGSALTGNRKAARAIIWPLKAAFWLGIGLPALIANRIGTVAEEGRR